MDRLTPICEKIDNVIDTKGWYQVYTIDEQMSSLSLSTVREHYTNEDIDTIMDVLDVYDYSHRDVYYFISNTITMFYDLGAIILFVNTDENDMS